MRIMMIHFFEKISIIIAMLLMSLWSGAEPTIGIFFKAGFTKIQVGLVYAISYMFTLNLFVWWPVVMAGKTIDLDQRWKDKKLWTIPRSWIRKGIKAIEIPADEAAAKQSITSTIFRITTFYAMGIGHLYLPGIVLVMLEPWTWRKFALGLSLYLGALSRVIVMLFIWHGLERLAWWLPWAAIGLFILYIIYQKFKRKKIAA